ncbi:BamA/TamA family outer membrane protein [Saccharicrinis sp. 156]|uniref:translocation and assembly module lipoprotein TamL n=1 Tax=Saccharicrinis sp. 156 TaxID=3417574 RepID=UPI003D3341EE
MAIFAASCSSVKNVPGNEYLLKKVVIKNNPRDISKERFMPFVKQRGNVRIFGTLKFHLGLYNLAGKDTAKKINKWLRRIGEAPVLYDGLLASQTADQLGVFLKNKGYFHAKVRDSLVYASKKKVKVIYDIDKGRQFKLGNIAFKAEDTIIGKLVLEEKKRSLLKKGKPFEVALHDAERERITRSLRNKGYYNFSKEFIYFKADSTLGSFMVNDSVIVKNARKELGRDKDTTFVHPTFRIKNVYYRMGYDTHKALAQKDAYFSKFDTLLINDCYFLYIDKVKVDPNVLYNSTYIEPGQLFSAELVDRTQTLLSSLKLYRFVNIRFERATAPDTARTDDKWLDCYIQLVPAKYQSYSIDIEGINSSGNLGAGGNLKYQHKNLFRGAEEFSFSFGASIQNQFDRQEDPFSTLEIGGETKIVFPKFWMPFKIQRFRKRYNPKTSLSVAYNHQRRPDYTRTIATGKISYLWKSNKNTAHTLAPLSINYIGIPAVNAEFDSIISNTYLKYSYENHLISSTSYSLVYNEQKVNTRTDFWYINWNIEEAGNILNLVSNALDTQVQDEDGDYFEVLGVRYAQYLQSDIDIRYHHYMNRINSMAYRFYLGVGYPYGNLNVLPFEKRYFSGGANSIRAWPVRGLGPGSYDSEDANYYNQTGDIKLEMNAEYRFNLFWMLEGAFFLDIGNIYTIRKDISPEGGLFTFKNFGEKLAVGTGLGLRFDLKYFIFRVDMGVKLRDPVESSGKRWLVGTRPYSWDDAAFNFAIGYPF